ncbi:hypothetical protein HFN80_02145 [Rhizobium laguerreae]|uniref:hypothetical protein n=1 Tax=Rhizobium laguerreae TaxID=1076926 RepID=UPI001C928E55|nr:hypothetical protein [Rhizobium laguerreae]MBY3257447.1 hypothetical protein [Rhizobium laguerreae]MBY3285591.1 hypothetical protein [Rhizobium laguerreae]MBY3292317.1 hypothetical protein [Rhizobium laguerreae]MBY3462824.1 hypothetical protein [Rhizobium laguerreae]
MKNRSKPRSGKYTADAPAVDVFTRSALASDLTWLPDMTAVGKPPLTAEAYVEAYLADPGEWYWSTLLLHDPSEIVLKRVLAIIEQAQLPGHEKTLGQLGAGPLEDLMSEELLDRLQHWLPFTPAMRHALSQVRMAVESPVLQQRLKAMLLR